MGSYSKKVKQTKIEKYRKTVSGESNYYEKLLKIVVCMMIMSFF